MRNIGTLCALGALAFTTALIPTVSGARANKAVVVTAPKTEDTVRQKVNYHDLQLATAQGQRTLRRRVGSAVRNTCFVANREYPTDSTIMKCERMSWNLARPQIDQAVLRARDIAASGKSSIAAAAITISLPAD